MASAVTIGKSWLVNCVRRV